MRRWRATASVLTFALALSASGARAQTGVRDVAASERGLISLQTRLCYTTMIVLPDSEEILDVIWGIGNIRGVRR